MGNNIFYDFLDSIPFADKGLMLRAMSDHEVMENCSSEEEYRMITGEDQPDNFSAYRPDKAVDAADIGEPGVSVKALKTRLKEIKAHFEKKPSMEKMRRDSLADPAIASAPNIDITITVGQLRDKADKLLKKQA